MIDVRKTSVCLNISSVQIKFVNYFWITEPRMTFFFKLSLLCTMKLVSMKVLFAPTTSIYSNIDVLFNALFDGWRCFSLTVFTILLFYNNVSMLSTSIHRCKTEINDVKILMSKHRCFSA